MNQCQTEQQSEFTVLRLAGEVDLSWSAEVRRAVLSALAGSDKVGVHLGEVSYIDSSGIAALVEGFQNARGRGQTFVLIAASDPVRAVLRLDRLDRVFELVEALPESRPG